MFVVGWSSSRVRGPALELLVAERLAIRDRKVLGIKEGIERVENGVDDRLRLCFGQKPG